jgi:hypothetical protein
MKRKFKCLNGSCYEHLPGYLDGGKTAADSQPTHSCKSPTNPVNHLEYTNNLPHFFINNLLTRYQQLANKLPTSYQQPTDKVPTDNDFEVVF